MQVEFSEEQVLLRNSARDFLERECPMELVRDRIDHPDAFPEALWQQLSDLGWTGLLVDPTYGGSGLDLVSLALVLEELGRALTPLPFIATSVMGAVAIDRLGTPSQRERWLPPLAKGQLRISLAHLEGPGGWGRDSIRLEARPDVDGLRLSGRKLYVQDATAAHAFLVPVRVPDAPTEIGLLLVDASSPGLSIRPLRFNEPTRAWCEVIFDDVRVPVEDRLGDRSDCAAEYDHVLNVGRAALAAEMTGSARKVLELTVDFAKQREQFGQPIGRFQAIAHKCADMLVDVEGMTSATYYSAWSLSHDEPDAATSAWLAKSFASEAYTRVAQQGIQVHGGLGFTWEQDLQLYFKHAQTCEFQLGAPAELRERAAQILIDQA